MTSQNKLFENKHSDLTSFLGYSFVITFVLFFLDEGYYDFRWMMNVGNWAVFFLYVFGLFGGQFLVHRLVKHLKFTRWPKAFSVGLGSIIGFALVVGLIFLNWALFIK